MSMRIRSLPLVPLQVALVLLAGCSTSDAPGDGRAAAAPPARFEPVPPASRPEPAALPVPPAPRTPAERTDEAADAAGAAGPYDRYLLGLALWRSGDLEAAERMLERAATELESFARAPVNLARVRLALGDTKGAREAIDRALAIDPSFAPARNVEARVLLAEGRREAAERALRAALDLDERDPWPANNLGYLLLLSGRADEAVALLEEATRRDADLAVAWNNLALALERSGRLDRAARAARRAADLSSDERYRATAARLALLAGAGAPETAPHEGTVALAADHPADPDRER